jgi:hypothetical protein
MRKDTKYLVEQEHVLKINGCHKIDKYRLFYCQGNSFGNCLFVIIIMLKRKR